MRSAGERETPSHIAHLRALNADAWDAALQRPEEAERTATAAIELARSLERPADEVTARLSRAWSRVVQGAFDRARDDVTVAQRIAAELPFDPDVTCKLCNALGAAHQGSSEFAAAISAYQESLAVAERYGLPHRQIAALNNLGEVELDLRHRTSARGLFERAAALLEHAPDRETEVVVLSNLGSVAMQDGDLAAAEQHFEAARSAARAVGDRFNEGELLSRLGVLAARRGDTAAAERLHTESVRTAGEIRSPVRRASALMNLGDLHRQLGQPDMARAIYEQARHQAETFNARHLAFRLYRRLAELAEERGDLETALAEYKRYTELKSALQEEWTERRLVDLSRSMEVERLRVVAEVAQEITSSLDLEEIFSQIYHRVNRVLDAHVFSIGLYDAAGDRLEYALVIEQGTRVEPMTVSLQEGRSFAAWVVRRRESIVIGDLQTEYRDYVDFIPREVRDYPAYSALFVPLLVKDRLVGVLSVQTPRAAAYSATDIRIVDTMAAFLAIAIDNAMIIDRVTMHSRTVVQEKDELLEAYQEISEIANRDHLTGLANRRYFQRYVEAHLSQRGESQEPLAVVFVDLDQFKPINDTYGHQAGDHVLAEIGRRLTADTRSGDLVARIGGDEFVVVLTEGVTAENVEAILAKLRDRVEEPIAINDAAGRFSGEVTVSASSGYAVFPDHGASYDELVSFADEAMYGRKRARR